MKRLPSKQMLHTTITEGTVKEEWVQKAAEKLVNFYLASSPVKTEPQHYRQKIKKEIEGVSKELLRSEFNTYRKKYQVNELKWKNRCNAYLGAADNSCAKFHKKQE